MSDIVDGVLHHCLSFDEGVRLLQASVCSRWREAVTSEEAVVQPPIGEPQVIAGADVAATPNYTYLTRVCESTRLAEWAVQSGCPRGAIAATSAALGQLDVLKWCHAQGEIITEAMCWNAAIGGHADTLRWINAGVKLKTRSQASRCLCPKWSGFGRQWDPPSTIFVMDALQSEEWTSPAAIVAGVQALRNLPVNALCAWSGAMCKMMAKRTDEYTARLAFGAAGGCEVLVKRLGDVTCPIELQQVHQVHRLVDTITQSCARNVERLVNAGIGEVLTKLQCLMLTPPTLLQYFPHTVQTMALLVERSTSIRVRLGDANASKVYTDVLRNIKLVCCRNEIMVHWASGVSSSVFRIITAMAPTHHGELVEEGICEIVVPWLYQQIGDAPLRACEALNALVTAAPHTKVRFSELGAVDGLVKLFCINVAKERIDNDDMTDEEKFVLLKQKPGVAACVIALGHMCKGNVVNSTRVHDLYTTAAASMRL